MGRRNRALDRAAAAGTRWGGTSACWAQGTSGPVLGGDRCRCVEREGCDGGGRLAGHWCPVVPQGWRHAISQPRAGVWSFLSFAEREEIAVLLAGRSGVREIARRLGRAPSTISRELQRNAALRTGPPEYRASTAQTHADRRGRRPKPAKLAVNSELRAYVQDRLSGSVQRPDGSVTGPQVGWRGRRQGPRKDRRWGQCWSPEQISCRLRVDFRAIVQMGPPSQCSRLRGCLATRRGRGSTIRARMPRCERGSRPTLPALTISTGCDGRMGFAVRCVGGRRRGSCQTGGGRAESAGGGCRRRRGRSSTGRGRR